MAGPMLEVADLQVWYGPVEVLQGVNFTVGEGEIVAILGANGSGKSTALKSVMGLVPARAGRVRFAGEDLTRLSAHQVVRRGIAHVPQGRHVFPDMTVHENLLMGAYARRGDLSRDFDEVYAIFPVLAERRSQPAGLLSGGEQQYLTLARALMSRPRFISLDEPSLGLSPLLVKQIFALVRRLRDEGLTFLVVEQLAYQALKNADRGYVLENGRMALSGTTAELLSDRRVQQVYLGSQVEGAAP